GAQRIGHGTRLAEDPVLLEEIVARKIPLEMCLTSNVHTHVVSAVAEHPFARYYQQGVVVTLNTDGRLTDGITLTDEYYLAHTALGLGPADLAPAPLQQQPAAPVQPIPRSLGSRLTGLFGIILILAIGIAFSRNRRAISWRVVAWGVGLQAVFAIFVLRIPIGQEIFSWLGATVTKILSFSYAGSEFVFGEIGKQHSSIGVVFAFQIMPAIIFVSA